MKAMILAAGLGTRLVPVTQRLPKPLLPVVGIPNIVRTLLRLKKAGIVEIVVNVHWLPDVLKQRLGDGSDFGVSITYSDEPELLGTGGGIRQARRQLRDETFIVVNGDALFAPDFEAALAFHKAHGAIATLLVRPDPAADRFGAVGVNAKGEVERLVYGGTDGPHLRNYMFTGVHLIEPALFDLLPEKGCIVRETYIPLVERRGAICALPTTGYFCDLGTPSRYVAANVALVIGAERIADLTPPTDGVYVGRDVVMDNGVTLGPGTVLSDRVRIRGTVHLERVVVLEGAEVTRSARDAIITADGIVVPARPA